MIITITHVEQAFTKNGDEYRKVVGITGDGRETTKSVFNQLKDKWGMLQENATLDFKMVKKGQFWNIEDINLPQVSAPAEKPTLTAEAPPTETPTAPATKAPAPQTRGEEITENMFWKELGEWLRLKENDDTHHPYWLAMRTAYFAKMHSSLPIKIEQKEG